MDSSSSSLPPHKNKNPSPKPHKRTQSKPICLLTITSFLLITFIQSLAFLKNSQTHKTQEPSTPKPTNYPTFHPLRNTKVPPYTNPNTTWFMSTLKGKSLHGMPEHFIFPSHPPYNKVLCINPHKKSYAIASAMNTFPAHATVVPGLTFVSDSYYDYENPWHSLNSLSVFFAWMKEKGCLKPKRFVIFKNGEGVAKVGSWISSLLKACLGGDVVIDSLESYGVACFEKAVVFRRGLGKMSSERRHGLFDMVRCKAWKHCNVSGSIESGEGFRRVQISLVGREGKRSFRNESGVESVMRRECDRVSGCKLKLVHLKNMSFCDQVRLMRNTDIFASVHGAQLTNMMFMPKGSSVMEMYPRGWLEGAGIGQYIYQWFASWSELNYEGSWRDSDGLDCPQQPKRHRSECFLKQKDQQVGLNETYLAEWTAIVLQRRAKLKGTTPIYKSSYKACPCD